MFSCHVKSLSRSAGRSAARACAYISGSTARDVYTGAEFDYGRKTRPVGVGFAHTVHRNAAEFAAALDGAEKRKDSCVAREVIVALPASISPGDRENIVKDVAERIGARWDVPVMWAIHKPNPKGDPRNHYAHLILGTRDGSGAKVRKLDVRRTGAVEVEWLRACLSERLQASVSTSEREAWDHRSFERRGVVGVATRHEGPLLTALRRRARRDGRESGRKVEFPTAQFNDKVRALTAELETINQAIEAIDADTRLTTSTGGAVPKTCPEAF